MLIRNSLWMAAVFLATATIALASHEEAIVSDIDGVGYGTYSVLTPTFPARSATTPGLRSMRAQVRKFRLRLKLISP